MQLTAWALYIYALIILLLLLLIAKFWKEIRFHWKFWTFFFFGFLIAVLLVPFLTLRRPCHVTNFTKISRALSYFFGSWLGVRFELRGAEYLSKEEGAMWATNHQHMADTLGLFNVMNVARRCTLIMKKELFYQPLGPPVRMYGVVFLNRRSGGRASHDDVNNWAHLARKHKSKVWIHPEGTRNFEAFKSQCLLPFKSGAFHAAVAAQIPVLPTVFSPYYFINYDKRIFGSGTVIIDVLPPIPTIGLTASEIPTLVDHVRDVMTHRYRELTKEVLSSLPESHPVFQWLRDTD